MKIFYSIITTVIFFWGTPLLGDSKAKATPMVFYRPSPIQASFLCLAPMTRTGDDSFDLEKQGKEMPSERYKSKNWNLEKKQAENDFALRDEYEVKLKVIREKVRDHFAELRETEYDNDFISEDEVNRILGYEKIILNLLKEIHRKIANGEMRPWLKDSDLEASSRYRRARVTHGPREGEGARIAIATGSYDFPTLAHFLMMLRTLAYSNVDFLVVGLEPDTNEKKNRLLPYKFREQQLLKLIEPLKDLIVYSEEGKYKDFRTFTGSLMRTYKKSKDWLQIIGSDTWLRFKGEFTGNKEVWENSSFDPEAAEGPLNYNLLVYNRPGEGNWASINEVESFSQDTNIPVVLDPMKEDISSTDVRSGNSAMVYPSLLTDLYAGFQLVKLRSQLNSKDVDKSC